MYKYIFECLHTHTLINTRIHTHKHTDIHTHTHMHTHAHSHTRTNTPPCMYVCMYVLELHRAGTVWPGADFEGFILCSLGPHNNC